MDYKFAFPVAVEEIVLRTDANGEPVYFDGEVTIEATRWDWEILCAEEWLMRGKVRTPVVNPEFLAEIKAALLRDQAWCWSVDDKHRECLDDLPFIEADARSDERREVA